VELAAFLLIALALAAHLNYFQPETQWDTFGPRYRGEVDWLSNPPCWYHPETPLFTGPCPPWIIPAKGYLPQ
jgi:hypothetical protein